MQYHPHMYVQFLPVHMCIFVTMKFLLGQSNCFMKPFVRRYKLKIAICGTIKVIDLLELNAKNILRLMLFDKPLCTRYKYNNMFADDIMINCFFIIIAFLNHTHKFLRMTNYTTHDCFSNSNEVFNLIYDRFFLIKYIKF